MFCRTSFCRTRLDVHPVLLNQSLSPMFCSSSSCYPRLGAPGLRPPTCSSRPAVSDLTSPYPASPAPVSFVSLLGRRATGFFTPAVQSSPHNPVHPGACSLRCRGGALANFQRFESAQVPGEPSARLVRRSKRLKHLSFHRVVGNPSDGRPKRIF